MTDGQLLAPRAALLAFFLLVLCPALANSTDGTVPAQPSGQPGFFRCPECGLEMPGADQGKPLLCPRCGQKKVAMQFSTSGKGTDSGPTTSYRFPLTMAGIAVTLGVVVVVLSRVRAAREAHARKQEQEKALPDAAHDEELRRYKEALGRQAQRRSKGKS